MSPRRPYLSKNIEQLEALHAANSSNQGISEAILHELGFRKTDRAALLRRRVQGALSRSPATKKDEGEPPLREKPRAGDHNVPPNIPGQGSTSTQGVSPPWPAPPPRSTAPDTTSGIFPAWIALEALTPQTYRQPGELIGQDRRCVARFDDGELPWEKGERSLPKKQLYYQIVLGSIEMSRATEALVKVYGDAEERSGREREKAAIAAILVNRQGVPLEENSVAVSSFAWALPIALGGHLNSLGGWSQAERSLVDGIKARIHRKDGQGNSLSLDRKLIRELYQWLISTLLLPQEFCEPPTFALRVYHFYKSRTPPEVALLNSFFLGDLARARQLLGSNRAGRALRRYVGVEKIGHSGNLLTDHRALEELVTPAKMPLSRWPSPGGHPLVLLQQAAVNAIRAEMSPEGAGLVAVNGPPGTGKTTLLRDIVASCVLDRALAMSAFEDPVSAFTAAGRMPAGDRAFLHLYRVDDALKGHEVLVASSNNKAVENVSKELPSKKAVGRDIKHFTSIASVLQSTRAEDGATVPGEPAWGLIAAVLGNALNRGNFQQALWWDEEWSLRLYLKAAKGDAVTREIRDEQGQVVRRELPRVVTEERPPTPEQAKLNWSKQRQRFLALHAEVERELRKLEEVRQACLQLGAAKQARSSAQSEHEAASVELAARERYAKAAQSAYGTAESARQAVSDLRDQVLSRRPGWFARLLRNQRYKEWAASFRATEGALTEETRRAKDAKQLYTSAMEELDRARRTCEATRERLNQAVRTLSAIETVIARHREFLGERLVDSNFFQRGHEQWNLSVPWVPDSLHQKREDLFEAALALHRAFIDVAAQKVQHNLGALMGAMQAGAFQDDEKKALLGDLWATLFMVVPVVSTTFASVERMLGDVAPSTFGWLLVDEAGQAAPQAAVGAVMRARRVIVVGDPLQIQPVVSLPERLVTEVCRYFQVDPGNWSAPQASVQTLADRASRLQAQFRTDNGVRQVGLPLLVHRRCMQPMFGISNRIAYDGQMVYAAGKDDRSTVGACLGESAWLNVDGAASSKWCAAEGEVVARLLRRLVLAGIQEPDLYIITPFRLVAQELRQRLAAETDLLPGLGVNAEEWLRNRVGTIHTFQGKEAEAVIAVLGAPLNAQSGARAWAAIPPNILNVMVSRAKKRLYVVGSYAAWSTVGHARTLAASLPIRQGLEDVRHSTVHG